MIFDPDGCIRARKLARGGGDLVRSVRQARARMAAGSQRDLWIVAHGSSLPPLIAAAVREKEILQPPVMKPASPLASSETYSRQAPLGSVPTRARRASP